MDSLTATTIYTTSITASTTSTPATATTTTPTTITLPTSVVVGEFNVTVKEARWIKALNGYNSNYENGSFLLVSFSVENIGKSGRLFGVIGEDFEIHIYRRGKKVRNYE